MPSRHRDPDEDRKDLLRSSRSRQQDMEMEPDSMEFKSVTALVTAACPSISAVRSRVDPDGKESADRRGDGEEEEKEGQKKVGKRKEEGDEREGSLKGACAGHMFLAEILEEEEQEEATEEEKGSREKAREEDDRGAERGEGDSFSCIQMTLNPMLSASHRRSPHLLPTSSLACSHPSFSKENTEHYLLSSVSLIFPLRAYLSRSSPHFISTKDMLIS